MQSPQIVIIGMGSRGLSVLEQLIGQTRQKPWMPLSIHLFDPQAPGSGLHAPEQADYLMLNTMAGQLSAFSSAHPAWLPGEQPGRTFWQWARDVRLDERGHVSDDCQARPIEFGDFVPRKLLGRYLQACYRYLLALCPAHVQVHHVAETVLGCQVVATASGTRFCLQSDNGRQLQADAVFLTCGHALLATAPVVGKYIAIEGLGLTAMDQVAALTQGRGGRYERDDSLSGWRYLPSGDEPQLYLFSRSGLPFHTRPQWRAGVSAPLKQWFFNAAALARLRRHSASGQLDFRQQVLPLIEDEMRAVFYLAKARFQGPERLAQVQQCLANAGDAEQRRQVFSQLADLFTAFEPRDYMSIQRWQGNPADYAQWYREWLANDLQLSRLGIAQSPLKQALEVWRDCRNVLRLAVDHNGLTEDSTLEFYRFWAGLSNRLVGGPQKERYEDLLALIDAGVVTVLPPMQVSRQGAALQLSTIDDPHGPVIEVDSLIQARAAHSGLSSRHSALIDDLQAQGLIKAAHPYPADGIAIDIQGRAMRRDCTVNERLWVLGPGVEGSTFYNHYVVTPDPLCKAALDARQAVIGCLAALSKPASSALETALEKNSA